MDYTTKMQPVESWVDEVLGRIAKGQKVLCSCRWKSGRRDVPSDALDLLLAKYTGFSLEKLEKGDLAPDEQLRADGAVNYICGRVTFADDFYTLAMLVEIARGVDIVTCDVLLLAEERGGAGRLLERHQFLE